MNSPNFKCKNVFDSHFFVLLVNSVFILFECVNISKDQENYNRDHWTKDFPRTKMFLFTAIFMRGGSIEDDEFE